jgi:hypothetical protein
VYALYYRGAILLVITGGFPQCLTEDAARALVQEDISGAFKRMVKLSDTARTYAGREEEDCDIALGSCGKEFGAEETVRCASPSGNVDLVFRRVKNITIANRAKSVATIKPGAWCKLPSGGYVHVVDCLVRHAPAKQLWIRGVKFIARTDQTGKPMVFNTHYLPISENGTVVVPILAIGDHVHVLYRIDGSAVVNSLYLGK